MREEVPAWPPGASRSMTMVRRPSEAPYTAAARPDGPAPTTTVSYSAAAASVPSPRSSATRRSWGLTTVLPPSKRMTGQSPSSGSGPPHCSAASGASGVTQRYEIWLRSRKWRSSAHCASARCRTRRRAAGAARRRCPAGRAARPCGRPRARRPRGHVRRHRGDRVVVARLQPHDARRLRRAEPDRERGADARSAPRRRCRRARARPTTLSIPSTRLDRLDAALEQGEERTLVALLRRVLAGQQA